RIHDITSISTQSRVGGAVGHHAPVTTHIHPAMVTHVHVPVVAHAHPRQHVQLVLGGAAIDTVNPVVEHDGPFDVLVVRVFGIADDQRSVQSAVELQATVGMVEV